MNNKFMTNQINIPTRENKILDLLITNAPEWFASCESIENSKFSDHKMISFNLTIKIDERPQNIFKNLYSTSIPLLAWNDADCDTWELYSEIMNQVQWFEIAEG